MWRECGQWGRVTTLLKYAVHLSTVSLPIWFLSTSTSPPCPYTTVVDVLVWPLNHNQHTHLWVGALSYRAVYSLVLYHILPYTMLNARCQEGRHVPYSATQMPNQLKDSFHEFWVQAVWRMVYTVLGVGVLYFGSCPPLLLLIATCSAHLDFSMRPVGIIVVFVCWHCKAVWSV